MANAAALSYDTYHQLLRAVTPKTTKYIRQNPTEKQTAFLLLDNLEAFYGGAAGGGKLLKLDTPIFTDKGWKTVGTLKETDRIVALDGSWTEIEYITPATMSAKAYEITFSNGERIVCDADHLWTVDRKRQVNKNHYHQIVSERITVTTQQIVDDGWLYKANNKIQKRYMLPQHYGVQGVEQELPIPPYLLGFWLGDGYSCGGYLTINSAELPHVLEQLAQYGEEFEVKQEQVGCWKVLVKNFTSRLNYAHLLNNKHIPLLYKLASRKQRVQLLQGLMDSDGHCQPRGRCEWVQSIKHQQLFDDVCELIASLGYKYSKSIAPTSFNENSFPSYKVTFTPREYVATLPSKTKHMFNDGKKDANSAVYIEDIRIVENCLMKCIRIKHPSHIFLIGKTFIPTHNSTALLAAALQYVDVPGYNAILFRRTYADLALPGALLDRAREWLSPFIPEVKWNDKEKTWIFPSGATLTFGYLETEKDKYRYQSAEFQFVGFDELTQFTETQYTYLFSRLRRLKGFPVPPRMRAASNPGGEGHDWVKQRFIIEGIKKGRIFIPARLEDNPYIDIDQYEESLSNLDPVTRAQLRWGSWDVKEAGYLFKREWFPIVDRAPRLRKIVRYWDLAGTEKGQQRGKTKAKDPDWTVGLLLGATRTTWYVLDVQRARLAPHDVEELVKETANRDGRYVSIYFEQEPGSSGLYVIEHFAQLLRGFAVRGNKSTGSKVLRANVPSAHAQRGQIKLVRGPWISDFLDELEMFPGGKHDDQVDALSGAFEVVDKAPNISAIPIGVGMDSDSYWVAAV